MTEPFSRKPAGMPDTSGLASATTSPSQARMSAPSGHCLARASIHMPAAIDTPRKNLGKPMISTKSSVK